jgi:hypothetical protein
VLNQGGRHDRTDAAPDVVVPSASAPQWVPARTEDGGQYLRCAHCGKDKTDTDLGHPGNVAAFGAGVGMISGGGG